MHSDKILVFGALGRVGSELIKALPTNVPVRAADLFPEKMEYPEHVERLKFDFNHPPADLQPLFAGVDRMFLLWPPGVDVKRSIAPVIEAAARAGIEQVVFLSILDADKLKIVPHRAVEKLLEASGMRWVFLRCAYFMQNLSGIHAEEIRKQDQIFIPAGSGSLGLIDVRDIAEVAAKALIENHANQVYNLTGGEALNFRQAAAIFSQVLGRPVAYASPSIRRFFSAMRRRGIPLGLVIFMIIEYTAARTGRSNKVTNQVRQLLGRPPITLRQFVEDHRQIWQPKA